MDGKCCTCRAPVNIAVIKYWGKRNEELILPQNSSLSVTLGMNELHAKTSVAVSSKFTEDRIWLNGKEQSVNNPRIQNVLKEIRRRYSEKNGSMGDGVHLKVHMCSENNFPTAAGLASSAAGYACMVYTLAKLYGVEGDLSGIARQGSGSACRSMYGGFVLWDQGVKDDGTDSLARQIKPASHWPTLRALILVVSDQKKQVGSTEGMQTTVETSELMSHRIVKVPQHTEDMIQAIEEKDFARFAQITMQESNQFHAVCLDTYPPVFYLTDTSRWIIHLVHAYNKLSGTVKVAYTFDAGPNACLYLLEEDVNRVVALVRHFFPPSTASETFVRGMPVKALEPSENERNSINIPHSEGAIKYIIHTEVGAGPEELDPAESLLTAEGLPKTLSAAC
ncbi:diphosphomevalonate decarboxylase-like [Babylonia areolata]|uniref:diphosphomevalonate decarboxylase-like n=1 Tax=Babylonia areolata TaxID=304850 RepID=UPI003FD5366B